MISVEDRDSVAEAVAVRLNVFESLTSPDIGPDFRHIVVEDGKFLRLIIAFVGRADGANGLAMLTTRNTPGSFELLHSFAMANYAEAPHGKEIRNPCTS